MTFEENFAAAKEPPVPKKILLSISLKFIFINFSLLLTALITLASKLFMLILHLLICFLVDISKLLQVQVSVIFLFYIMVVYDL